MLLILPFCLLIRGAVYLYFEQSITPYVSLLISSCLTAVLLVIYFSIWYGRRKRKKTRFKYLRRRFAILFLLVGGFVLYGIMYISPSNTKNSAIVSEFRQLQPILRLASSTLFLIDRKTIITDGSRMPEDYRKMGLSTPSNSLHYPQQDGYAYALDLRTQNRSEFRNQVLVYYFSIMGLNTLRHIGTADHLHISLPCRFREKAK